VEGGSNGYMTIGGGRGSNGCMTIGGGGGVQRIYDHWRWRATRQ
jgi:hypothetical protein